MPINEAVLYKRGGLTPQQKFDQQAYVYGLNPKDYRMSPNAAPQFTHEQLEQMRQILAQHGNAGQTGVKEFDLNNPPTTQYRYQEYPRAVYDHVKGRNPRNVNSAEELEEALQHGWSMNPNPPAAADEAEDAGLSVEDKALAAELDSKLVKPKAANPPAPRKNVGGRPRKDKPAPAVAAPVVTE